MVSAAAGEWAALTDTFAGAAVAPAGTRAVKELREGSPAVADAGSPGAAFAAVMPTVSAPSAAAPAAVEPKPAVETVAPAPAVFAVDVGLAAGLERLGIGVTVVFVAGVAAAPAGLGVPVAVGVPVVFVAGVAAAPAGFGVPVAVAGFAGAPAGALAGAAPAGFNVPVAVAGCAVVPTGALAGAAPALASAPGLLDRALPGAAAAAEPPATGRSVRSCPSAPVAPAVSLAEALSPAAGAGAPLGAWLAASRVAGAPGCRPVWPVLAGSRAARLPADAVRAPVPLRAPAGASAPLRPARRGVGCPVPCGRAPLARAPGSESVEDCASWLFWWPSAMAVRAC
jgi:hypothetical protein